MADLHEGGCLCGAVRYRVDREPLHAGICHCTFCKRRTGSAFGLVGYFANAAVAITSGVLKSYEYRSDETGRWLRMEFCPHCGTTVTWTAEWFLEGRAVALGTFDDPNWIEKLNYSVWTRSALPWVVLPADVATFEKDPDSA